MHGKMQRPKEWANKNMKYDPAIHRRRSIRLRNYDYSRSGAYFVTICTQNRANLFGEIINGTQHINDAGHMINRWYYEQENKFPAIKCGEFICMPNHIHFILYITTNDSVGADLRVRPSLRPQQSREQTQKSENQGGHIGPPLHAAVQWFKTMTTNEYIRHVDQSDWLPFDKKLWQRNYWEHVIRNDDELTEIQTYIQSNPARWAEDALYVE